MGSPPSQVATPREIRRRSAAIACDRVGASGTRRSPWHAMAAGDELPARLAQHLAGARVELDPPEEPPQLEQELRPLLPPVLGRPELERPVEVALGLGVAAEIQRPARGERRVGEALPPL